MEATKQKLINRFFEAYFKRDFDGIKKVMAENVVWTFLGKHKLAGVRNGLNEVIAFFDTMAVLMSNSKPNIDKLIIAENENYVIECQHIKTNREDGINIDHYVCVLWTFENGKIISGRHFFADPEAENTYFNAVTSIISQNS